MFSNVCMFFTDRPLLTEYRKVTCIQYDLCIFIQLYKFGSFAYSKWPPKWSKCSIKGHFSAYILTKTHVSTCRHEYLLQASHINYVPLLGSPKKLIAIWLICIFKMATKMQYKRTFFSLYINESTCFNLQTQIFTVSFSY